jgi:hypothetical protein
MGHFDAVSSGPVVAKQHLIHLPVTLARKPVVGEDAVGPFGGHGRLTQLGRLRGWAERMTVRKRNDARGRVEPRRALFDHARKSPLLRTPAKPLTLILVVEALCVTCLVAANLKSPATVGNVADFSLIVVLSALFAEVGNRVEVLRRYLCSPNDLFISPTSVWLLAGVFALPLGLAALVPAVLGVHTLIRDRRAQASKPHRIVYSALALGSCSTQSRGQGRSGSTGRSWPSAPYSRWRPTGLSMSV